MGAATLRCSHSWASEAGLATGQQLGLQGGSAGKKQTGNQAKETHLDAAISAIQAGRQNNPLLFAIPGVLQPGNLASSTSSHFARSEAVIFDSLSNRRCRNGAHYARQLFLAEQIVLAAKIQRPYAPRCILFKSTLCNI